MIADEGKKDDQPAAHRSKATWFVLVLNIGLGAVLLHRGLSHDDQIGSWWFLAMGTALLFNGRFARHQAAAHYQASIQGKK